MKETTAERLERILINIAEVVIAEYDPPDNRFRATVYEFEGKPGHSPVKDWIDLGVFGSRDEAVFAVIRELDKRYGADAWEMNSTQFILRNSIGSAHVLGSVQAFREAQQ